MLRIGIAMTLAIATAFAVDLAAQPPNDDRDNDRDRPAANGDDDNDRPRDGERRRGDFDGRRDFRGRGGPDGRRPDFRMPPSPLMRALDTDHNGELSAKEVKNASKSLASLDKNDDKKLSREELRPRFGRPGPPREFNSDRFVERFLQRDKNKDGKISKDEFPERGRDRFDRIDGNDDGALDRAELKKMAEQFAARMNRGPRDGDRGGRGRGDRDRGDRDRGDRPDRDGDSPDAADEDAPKDNPDSITRDDL